MKLIHNPKERGAPVKAIYEGEVWEIGLGETLSFEEKDYVVADFLMTTYGFLEEIAAEKGDEKLEGKFICEYCGFEAKNAIGLYSHKRYCKKAKAGKKPIISEEKMRIVKARPKAKLVPKGLSRSEKENIGFTDMPELRGGITKTEEIGGKEQSIVYDRDGVGWYGPGIEEDFPDDFSGNRGGRPGKF